MQNPEDQDARRTLRQVQELARSVPDRAAFTRGDSSARWCSSRKDPFPLGEAAGHLAPGGSDISCAE